MKATSKLLAALLAIAFVNTAFAASAGAPSISGSNVIATGTVVNSDTRSVQGNSSGASAGGSYKLFSAKASKNKSSDTMFAETTAGGAFLDGNTRVMGSTVNLNGTVANSSNSGGTVQAGVLRTTSQ